MRIGKMREEEKLILDYVEGRIAVEDFHVELLQNRKLQKLLSKPLSREYEYLRPYNYRVYNYLTQDWLFTASRWQSIPARYGLQAILAKFLSHRHIHYEQYSKYEDDYVFLLKIQPSWLDINDDGVFQQIMDAIPQDISKAQQIKIGKEKIKELFRYDKTYPRWLQSPEWPIVNGKPLVFSHQKRVEGDDMRTLYYFYDPDTHEQTVVDQFT